LQTYHPALTMCSHMALLMQVRCLSRLYESAPAYVTDQPPFLNAAALVETSLPPLDLLRTLKQLEVRCCSPTSPAQLPNRGMRQSMLGSQDAEGWMRCGQLWDVLLSWLPSLRHASGSNSACTDPNRSALPRPALPPSWPFPGIAGEAGP
jgi:hypothetical protein